jgi:hypothetical protein
MPDQRWFDVFLPPLFLLIVITISRRLLIVITISKRSLVQQSEPLFL